MSSPRSVRFHAAWILALSLVGVTEASSGGFEVSVVGQKLVPVEEGDVVRYKLKVPVNEPLTFVATGMAYPRGAAPAPMEPDAGAWLFDDAVVQLVPHEKAKFDKTRVALALKPLKAGMTKVRFVGNCLGYDRKFEILLEVVEK